MRLNELTALYSPLDREYAQMMSGPYEDLSSTDDECEIVASLKYGKITGFWRPVVAVGDERSQKIHIERLYDISRDIEYMDFLIDGELSVISRFLLRQGYRARPYYTQILDLTRSEETLRGEMRKSYKSLVNKDKNVRVGTIDDYRNAHDRHGGHRRCSETWRVQERMIQGKEAFCLTDGKAAVLIYENDFTAYYAGCRGPEGHNTHALMWQAIVRSRAKSFEMGEQVFSGDTKLMNISKYKRGFGGKTRTRLLLEKP